MNTPLLGNRRLHELFSEVAYCETVYSERNGSMTIHPEGFYFLALPNGESFTNGLKRVLYAKPVRGVVDAALPYCIRGLQSFEIIPWCDKALVVARDGASISSPWIAFIPLEDLP